MDEKLSERLTSDFPNLYWTKGLSAIPNKIFHFEIDGDGWEPILRSLSEKLEPKMSLLTKEERDDGFYLAQCKQKLGGLRFYLYYPDTRKDYEEVQTLIAEAEKLSTKTCEVCGEPGILRGKHWLSVSCDKHAPPP